MTHVRHPTPDPRLDAPESDGGEDRAWYLYGIIHAVRHLPEEAAGVEIPAVDPVTVGEMPLQRVTLGDLAAVVRAVSRSDFTDEALQARLGDPATLEEMVREHNEVITALHAQQAILPAKFGAVYARLEDLQRALEERAPALHAGLDHIEGCDEWALHVYVDRAAFERHVAAGDPSLRRLRDDLAQASPGRAYFLQRKLANDLAGATDAAMGELATSVYEDLRRLSVDAHVTSASGPAVAGQGAIEVLRAAFLVSRADTEAFLSAADSLAADREGVRIEHSGPWPPYSFAAEGERG